MPPGPCPAVHPVRPTSQFGSSCHWCRQKTIDRKVQCSNPDCLSISTWCGSCLWNRHREDILSAIDDPEWLCPACLGECNCSLAGQFACGMYRRGKSKTGALNSIAEIKNGSMTPNQYIRLKMYKGEVCGPAAGCRTPDGVLRVRGAVQETKWLFHVSRTAVRCLSGRKAAIRLPQRSSNRCHS